MSCDHTVTNESENVAAFLNKTDQQLVFEKVTYVLYCYGLPIICACGFLGNVLNLVILAGKRIQRSLKHREQSANTCLIALAFADMMFCIMAFPTTFLPSDGRYEYKGFMLYYSVYCAAIINIFIMTSTWLTVSMATERYLAICHPLRSRNFISLQRTKVAIVMVYLLSTVFNLPVFLRYHIKHNKCGNVTWYSSDITIILSDNFDHAYRAIWAIVGNLIPLLLLFIFNFCLMREIHKSYAMRKQMNGQTCRIHHYQRESSNRVTITLLAIVIMFFILVAPSEVIKHVAYLTGSDLSRNYTYLTVEVITNLMQTINFSANFILYCIINRSFRRRMQEMLCFRYRRYNMDHSEMETQTQYETRRINSLRTNSLIRKLREDV